MTNGTTSTGRGTRHSLFCRRKLQSVGHSLGARIGQNGITTAMRILTGPDNILTAFLTRAAMAAGGFATGRADETRAFELNLPRWSTERGADLQRQRCGEKSASHGGELMTRASEDATSFPAGRWRKSAYGS